MPKSAINLIPLFFCVSIGSLSQSATAQEASNTPESLAIDLTRQFIDTPINSIRVQQIRNADASVAVIIQTQNSSCRILTRQIVDQWAAVNLECSKDTQNAYK